MSGIRSLRLPVQGLVCAVVRHTFEGPETLLVCSSAIFKLGGGSSDAPFKVCTKLITKHAAWGAFVAAVWEPVSGCVYLATADNALQRLDATNALTNVMCVTPASGLAVETPHTFKQLQSLSADGNGNLFAADSNCIFKLELFRPPAAANAVTPELGASAAALAVPAPPPQATSSMGDLFGGRVHVTTVMEVARFGFNSGGLMGLAYDPAPGHLYAATSYSMQRVWPDVGQQVLLLEGSTHCRAGLVAEGGRGLIVGCRDTSQAAGFRVLRYSAAGGVDKKLHSVLAPALVTDPQPAPQSSLPRYPTFGGAFAAKAPQLAILPWGCLAICTADALILALDGLRPTCPVLGGLANYKPPLPTQPPLLQLLSLPAGAAADAGTAGSSAAGAAAADGAADAGPAAKKQRKAGGGAAAAVVAVRVGGRAFVAHCAVLEAHSEYLAKCVGGAEALRP
jgi:hypothetical protein